MKKFTIRLAGPGQLEVFDGTTTTGDFSGGRREKLVWEVAPDSVKSFSLRFGQYIKTGGALRLEPGWPFGQWGCTPAGSTIDLEEGTVTNVTRFWGRLASGDALYRYTVSAKPLRDSDCNGGEIVINPVIIVEE